MDYPGFKPVAAFDQSVTLNNPILMELLSKNPKDNATPDRNGICSGLCTLWIAYERTYGKTSAEQRLRDIGTRAGFKFGSRSQKQQVAPPANPRDPGESMMAMYSEQMAAFGMKLNDGGIGWWNDIDGFIKVEGDAGYQKVSKFFSNEVQRNRKHFMIHINLKRSSGQRAGHAIACYKSGGTFGGHFHLFDPNVGQFTVDLSDTAKLITAMLQAYKAIDLEVASMRTMEVLS